MRTAPAGARFVPPTGGESPSPARGRKFRAAGAAYPIYAPGGRTSNPLQEGCFPAPHSLFRGIAATALLGRAASAALTQGARVSGDRSLFNQKGPPLRCAQWGTKEMVPPGGTREKSSGPRSAFARRKLKCTPDTPTIAAFLRKCSAAPNRGPGAICQRGQCRARRRELQEWSDQSPSHWGPRRAQRGGEWNHVPP